MLCGGVSELIMAGFDTLVEAGYQPEIAYFEVLHELKLIVDLIYKGGIDGMRSRSPTPPSYGDLPAARASSPKRPATRCAQMLEEIQDGSSPRSGSWRTRPGRPVFNALRRIEADHPIEEVGKQLRGMMSWLQKK